jgi:hypothetical protein
LQAFRGSTSNEKDRQRRSVFPVFVPQHATMWPQRHGACTGLRSLPRSAIWASASRSPAWARRSLRSSANGRRRSARSGDLSWGRAAAERHPGQETDCRRRAAPPARGQGNRGALRVAPRAGRGDSVRRQERGAGRGSCCAGGSRGRVARLRAAGIACAGAGCASRVASGALGFGADRGQQAVVPDARGARGLCRDWGARNVSAAQDTS